MPDLVTFGPTATIERLGAPQVYTRARWADDWEEEEHLYPEDVAWSCSPTMPTATLLWQYGRLAQPGSDPDFVDRLDWHPGRYVKIVVPCDLDAAATAAAGSDVFVERTWYGLIEQIVDDQQGLFEYQSINAPGAVLKQVATGTQRLICLGMEQILARHRIRSCFFDRGAGITTNDSTIPFNLPGGRGNRGTTDYDGAYVFYYDLDGGAANVSTWSTREIVRYLLRRQTPVDVLGVRNIRFRVHTDSVDKLPNWDLPFLDQDNATTLALLQRLVDRRRLLTCWFDVVEDGAGDIVEMHVETIVPNDVPLSIGPAAVVPAAARQLTINYDKDQATRGHVRDSELGVYDRVIARGAKMLYVASFSHQDGTLQAAWRPGDQSLYEYGASATAGYSAATLAEKQKRNAAARSDPRLEDVFCRFRIPPTWDQKAGDGFGGVFAGFSDVFVGPGGPVPSYYPSIVLRSSLPLCAKTNYANDAITTGAAAASEPKGDVDMLPILHFWKRPKADADGVRRWFRGDEIGRLARMEGVDPEDADRVTIHAHVIPQSHSVVFRTGNATQHAIAYGTFNPLPEDPASGQWSYANGSAVVTLAMENGTYVEGQWPIVGPFGKDAIRTLVVDAGAHYERVRVTPMTVVGIDSNGALVRSTGGMIERPVNVLTLLADLAHLAHAWYSIPHQVLTIESQRLKGADSIALGDLVIDVGDPAVDPNPAKRTVNASVSEIRIRWEQSTNADMPPEPSMTIHTFAGELDALAVGPAGIEGEGNPFRLRRPIKL